MPKPTWKPIRVKGKLMSQTIGDERDDRVTFAYFDTSALIKRYVSEKGSKRVMSLLRRHDLLSSAITPVEVMSALCRRKRNGELSDEDFTPR